jgi:cyanophycinase-like exopeptidase
MTKKALLFILILFSKSIYSQIPFTSYFTGDTSNVVKTTQLRVCLMGGATEDNNAMKWFLNGSGGGDIVVLRVTGTNGYNNYLYTTLGIPVNSVETLVIPSISAANNPYVRRRIREAEAVFIAGGNQFDYVSYWKNTAVDTAINYLINTKKTPIGGTSAGMAIQGQAYYSAALGSVTSSVALSNPYNSAITIGNNDFIKNPLLKRVITDTHYDNPDRRGRQTTFLARLFQDSAKAFYGIACDEYTAVCFDSTGIAKVFGGFPTYDDNAYFIQPNCILPNAPETCSANISLTWNRSGQALKVYAVKGTSLGAGTFDLKNWQNPNATGGNWQDWFAINGTFSVTNNASPIICLTTDLKINSVQNFEIYPNPVSNHFKIYSNTNFPLHLKIRDGLGKLILEKNIISEQETIDVSEFETGIYFLEIKGSSNEVYYKKILKE